ncbi:MAG: hypothetical protein AAGA43_13385 [Bacteroidota bacterium]
MSKNKTSNKEYEKYELEWSGIPINIEYCLNYWSSANVSHLKISALEPLPFTETGFKSVWLYEGQLKDRTPIEYVREALETDSQTKKWQSYLEDKKIKALQSQQMALF